eukprot:764079-Hanusia_phi.AAC.10
MDHHYTGTKTVSGALHKVNKEFKKVSKSLTSDDTFRSFMDKTTSALTFDGVKKAVLKATSFEHGPPKEKHVQTLIQECQYNNSPELLQEVKSACINFVSILTHHSTACWQIAQQRCYSDYLCCLHGGLTQLVGGFESFDGISSSSVGLSQLSTDQLIIDVEAMMLLLDAGYRLSFDRCSHFFSNLNSCSFRENSVVHPTSIAAFSIVFKDVRVLYQSLNKAILRLLDNYFELPKAIAEKILTLYKMFLDHNKKVARFV